MPPLRHDLSITLHEDVIVGVRRSRVNLAPQAGLCRAQDLQRVAPVQLDEACDRRREGEESVQMRQQQPRAAVGGASGGAGTSGGAHEGVFAGVAGGRDSATSGTGSGLVGAQGGGHDQAREGDGIYTPAVAPERRVSPNRATGACKHTR